MENILQKTNQDAYVRRVILAPTLVSEDPQIKFLNNLIQTIERHVSDQGFIIPELSRLIGMSPSVLYKKVKALTNMTVNDFIKAVRLKKAAELLKTQNLTVNEISAMVGFDDRRYFSKEFKKQFGKAPKEWGSAGKFD